MTLARKTLCPAHLRAPEPLNTRRPSPLVRALAGPGRMSRASACCSRPARPRARVLHSRMLHGCARFFGAGRSPARSCVNRTDARGQGAGGGHSGGAGTAAPALRATPSMTPSEPAAAPKPTSSSSSESAGAPQSVDTLRLTGPAPLLWVCCACVGRISLSMRLRAHLLGLGGPPLRSV